MTDSSRSTPAGNFTDGLIATAGGLALAFIAMFLLVVPLSGKISANRDFVLFWATGQQLTHHLDPYDAASIERIELGAGLPRGYNSLSHMRNPPWALPLVLPLGLVGVRTAALLWSLLLLACLVTSSRLLWDAHGRPSNRTHWLAFSFAPALFCVTMGQITLFALLGLVLFERLHSTRPFAAGLALWLCALKPHLFLPLIAVLAVWIVFSHSYKVLAGAATALAASSAAAWLIAPSAWSEYPALMRSPAMAQEFIPCLGVALRLRFDPVATWLQYLPAAIACVWALVYYWRHRAAWNWQTHGSFLALVSLVAAPYSWLYDQALALPALLDGAYSTRWRWIEAVLALMSISILALMICGVQIASDLYIWTGPPWLAWYLLARMSTNTPLAAQE